MDDHKGGIFCVEMFEWKDWSIWLTHWQSFVGFITWPCQFALLLPANTAGNAEEAGILAGIYTQAGAAHDKDGGGRREDISLEY